MGVQGLWSLLSPASRPTQLESLRQKKIAVDASIWIHQFMRTMRDKEGNALRNGHLLGFFRRLCKLLFFDIKPIFVFDGGAPVIKRTTIRERRKRREGVKVNLRATAKKILTAQIKSRVLLEQERKKLDDEQQPPDEDFIYAAELEKTTKSIFKPVKLDQYELPDIPKSDHLNQLDPRLATHQEIQNFVNEFNPSDLDIDSDVFQSLPTEIQYEVIQDLKNKSRQTSWTRLDQMVSGSSTALDFSKHQIKLLQHRNTMTQRLLHMNTVAGGNIDLEPARIAGERGRQYILYKNEDLDQGLGWKLPGLTASEPVDLDHITTRPEPKLEVPGKSEPEDKVKAAIASNPKLAALFNNYLDGEEDEGDEGDDEDEDKESIDAGIVDREMNTENVESFYEASDEENDQPIFEVYDKEDNAPHFQLSDKEDDEPIFEVYDKEVPDKKDKSQVSDDENDEPLFFSNKESNLVSDHEHELINDMGAYMDNSDEEEINQVISNIYPKNTTPSGHDISLCSDIDEEKDIYLNREEEGYVIDTPLDTGYNSEAELDENNEKEINDFAMFVSNIASKDINVIRKDLYQDIKDLNSQQKKNMGNADDVTDQMVQDIQELLKLFGIPYIVSPMEAEAQCAELEALSLVDGTITDDSDVFLFGASRVYKNMFNQQRFVECYQIQDIEREMLLNRQTFIQLAYLLGSDYTEGIPGVGPVTAMEILSEFSVQDNQEETLEAPLIRFKDWYNGQVDDTPFKKKFRKQHAEIDIPNDFPDPQVKEAYYNPTVDKSTQQFEWGQPQLDSLRIFLTEAFGWSEEKADQVLLPVLREMNNKKNVGEQQVIGSFFNVSGNVSSKSIHKHSSKRVQTIVEKWRKQKKVKSNH